MKQPRVNIGVTKEENRQTQKLNCTEKSRVEALRKIEQDLRKREKNTTPMNTANRDKPIQATKENIVSFPQQLRTPQKNSLNHFPIFPGNDPNMYPMEGDLHREPFTMTTSQPTDERIHVKEEKQDEPKDSIVETKSEKLEIKPFTVKTSTFVKQPNDFYVDQRDPSKFKHGLIFSLSVLGAVALGSLLGYLLLLIVLAGDGIATLDEQNNAQHMDQETVTTPVSIDLIQGGTATVGKLTVADRTFYAIQAGAFLEEERGVQAYENLKQQEVPALLFEDDVHRLFLGIGYHEEDVADLRSMYRWLDTELYLKKYTIQGGTIAVAGASRSQMEMIDTFFIHGTYLLEKTAAWTSDALNGNFSVTGEDWNKFKATHETFLQEAKQLSTFLSQEQMQQITKMKESIDQAVLAMVRYIETGEMKQAVLSQQGLLQYFDAYRNFLKMSTVS